jgi:predicted dithiol-disulfide oxidoreductase (DUF899 family)
MTRARDELAAQRRRLPMVEVVKDYRFIAADGSTRTLLDLFEGRHQLIVDHYMFDPVWEDGVHELRRPGRSIREHSPRVSTSTTACRSTTRSTIPHYNYRSAAEESVFHTYSAYARGTEQMGGTHYYLDTTALGRQEDWEEPKGRAESLGPRADQRAAPARFWTL